MTIQIKPAMTHHAGPSPRPTPGADQTRFPMIWNREALQQLAGTTARVIQEKLQVDLVWIAEVAVTERANADDLEDDDDGCRSPDVTVLAVTAKPSTIRPDHEHTVLPACLTQIAWEAAELGHTVEMDLRNPPRTLAAFPVVLHSGARLVLIVVARHSALSRGDIRTLERLVAAIGLATHAPHALIEP
jgi:hypothetical protein